MWYGVDPLADKYPNISPYTYCANKTWSNPKTWKDLGGISRATFNLFGDYVLGRLYEWKGGGNYAELRTNAALGLIDHVRSEMKSESFNGEITLVGHSHGGNVSIQALNMMAEMEEFDNIQLNLLSINTPVRNDYQLSDKAAGRVSHVNVYDPQDPVQANGGNAIIILPESPSIKKGTGEYGPANRTFDNATNIQVNNSQGAVEMKSNDFSIWPGIGDFHNSHNWIKDWIKKTEDK